MNAEEMSDMIQKITNMMNQTSTQPDAPNENTDTISSDTTQPSFNNPHSTASDFHLSEDQTNNDQEDNNAQFQFDFETMMKIKNIVDAFHSTQNSPETNLLLSLKPYLNSNRKQKLDQYIQFLNLTKVMETFQANGGVNKNAHENK